MADETEKTYRERRAEHTLATARWRRGEGDKPPPFDARPARERQPPAAPDGPGDAPPARVLPPLDYGDDEVTTTTATARDTLPPAASVAEFPRAVRWVVCGDVHFRRHSEPHWRAFAAFVTEQKPDALLLNGDMIDFGAISRFDKTADDPTEVLSEIKYFVAEVNALVPHCGRVVLNAGNHESRWSRAVQGSNAQALRGVAGLDLHAVLVRHGLSDRVEWCREGVGFRGVVVGDALARHGDRQAGKFSGRYVAATAMARAQRNVLVSHHHKGQLHAETFEDRTVWGLAVPTMELEQEFAPGAPWVRGFALVEVAPDGAATPYLVIMDARTGRFSYGGRVYGG